MHTECVNQLKKGWALWTCTSLSTGCAAPTALWWIRVCLAVRLARCRAQSRQVAHILWDWLWGDGWASTVLHALLYPLFYSEYDHGSCER